jgi:adenylate cyclase
MAHPDPHYSKEKLEEIWHYYLTHGDMPSGLGAPWFMARRFKPLVKRLPSDPRCRLCDLPFDGVGGFLTRSLLDLKPSPLNPHICNICEDALRAFNCGAEVEVSLLFADVRGSTGMAEKLSPGEFSRMIDRFYTAASKVIFWKNGLVEKLIGDEVAAFFVPGFAGANHARVTVEAAEAILRETGHADAHGPWIPVGIGVHTGLAYVGAVGAADAKPDITVLGDSVNTAARLASQARAGEVLVSTAAHTAAGLPEAGLEARHLTLKGRREPIDVWVRRIA